MVLQRTHRGAVGDVDAVRGMRAARSGAQADCARSFGRSFNRAIGAIKVRSGARPGQRRQRGEQLVHTHGNAGGDGRRQRQPLFILPDQLLAGGEYAGQYLLAASACSTGRSA